VIRSGKAVSRTLLQPVAALLLAAVQFAAAGQELAPYDSPAPGFTLPDQRGAEHTLADYRGKVVLVNFWASWCPPCIHEMPALQQLAATLDGEPFEIVAINTGEQKYRVWKFSQLINLELPVLLDPGQRAFEDWQVMILPTSFLIDRDGRIRYRAQGVPDWNSTETIALSKGLMQEENNQ